MHLTNTKVVYMKKQENKVDFDLSVLRLEELIKVYENIDNFIKYLNDKKIVLEEKVKASK